MSDSGQTGKVMRAALYTCKAYAHPSRDNETMSEPQQVFEGDSHTVFMSALAAFASSRERSSLVLELDNGREITIIPTLQDDSPAMGEEDYSLDSPVSWDLSLSVWPR